MFYIQGSITKHILKTAIAMLLAAIASYYVSMSHEGWAIFAAFIVCQTTRGTPLRQSLIYLLTMLLAVLAVSLILQSPAQDRMMDILLGGFIGIICNIFIFPVRPEKLFKQDIVPLLVALANSMQSTIEYLKNENHIEQKKLSLFKILEIQKKYPEWIFETGFNPGLRAGFRFYLVQINYLIEIIFVMDNLIANINLQLLQPIFSSVLLVLEKNKDLLNALVHYFSTGQISQADKHADLSHDIAEMEDAWKNTNPPNLEQIMNFPEYLSVVAFLRDLKDFREILLKLLLALPEESYAQF